jgi:hypothetical protein
MSIVTESAAIAEGLENACLHQVKKGSFTGAVFVVRFFGTTMADKIIPAMTVGSVRVIITMRPVAVYCKKACCGSAYYRCRVVDATMAPTALPLFSRG